MIKQLWMVLILVAGVAAVWGADQKGGGDPAAQAATAGEAYVAMRKARSEVDSPVEKVELTKKFLDNYIGSEQTAEALDAVFYYQGTEMGDVPGALEYAESIRARISDPAVAREVDRKMIAFYAEAGMHQKMKTLAGRLADDGVLDFDDHWNVIEGGVKAGDWELVRDYCARARAKADASALRAERPNHEYTEDELAQAVAERLGMLMIKDAWARANQGYTDEALAAFAEADKIVPRYYFKVAEYDLYVYWGNTLVKKGDFQAAIDLFAESALILGNEDAKTGLKAAYAGIHGSDAGFEAYADNLRRQIAPVVEDFELPDYEGERHRFSDIRGDVTLLALWFPT